MIGNVQYVLLPRTSATSVQSVTSLIYVELVTGELPGVTTFLFLSLMPLTSQVHEIHPSHPFLSVPDQLSSVQGEADNEAPRRSLDMSGEPCKLLSLFHGFIFVLALIPCSYAPPGCEMPPVSPYISSPYHLFYSAAQLSA